MTGIRICIGIVVFMVLGALSRQVASASTSQIPDGLCLLLGANGSYGHGFIYRDKLVTAAHVFDFKIHRLFVTQQGVLKDMTGLIAGEPQLHPAYARLRSALAISKSFLPTYVGVPIDLGVLQLRQAIRSDFELTAYKSVPDLLQKNELLGVSDQWSIARIRVDRDLIDRLRAPQESFKFQAEVNALTEIEAFQMTVDLDKDEINLSEENVRRANVFINTSILNLSGHSGMPLFGKLRNGRLMVTGLASAISEFSDYPSNVQNQQNFFTPAINLKDLIRLDAQPANSIFQTCSAFKH